MRRPGALAIPALSLLVQLARKNPARAVSDSVRGLKTFGVIVAVAAFPS